MEVTPEVHYVRYSSRLLQCCTSRDQHVWGNLLALSNCYCTLHKFNCFTTNKVSMCADKNKELKDRLSNKTFLTVFMNEIQLVLRITSEKKH